MHVAVALWNSLQLARTHRVLTWRAEGSRSDGRRSYEVADVRADKDRRQAMSALAVCSFSRL